MSNEREEFEYGLITEKRWIEKEINGVSILYTFIPLGILATEITLDSCYVFRNIQEMENHFKGW